MSDKLKKAIIIIIVVAVVLFALVALLTGFITEFLWFKDLGYVSVFLKELLTKIEIGVPVFVVLFTLGILYLRAINKGYHKRTIVAKERLGKKGQSRIGVIISAIASLVISYITINSVWFTSLQFGNSTSFDIKDPIFNQDVSFYLFKLQFIHGVNNIVIVGIIIFALMTFVYYALLLSIAPASSVPKAEPDVEEEDELSARRKASAKKASPFFENLLKSFGIDPDTFGGGKAKAKPQVQAGSGQFKEIFHIASKQITVLGILFFLMVGINFLLRQFDLLYTSTDVLYGAAFTDINITLWVYRALIVLSVIAAIAFAIGIKKKKLKTVIVVPIIMVALGVVGMGAETLVQNLIVSPDAINKESKYLGYNIEYTQNAYDLQNVSVKDFAADNELTGEDIVNNKDTIKNIRINDYDPAKIFYNSTQSIRQYYDFNDVDVDRYMINGEYTQTFLTAREIDESKLPQQWLNLHLKYTHGYGVTLSRVDKVTTSGQPDLLIKNIPPESQVEEIEITTPQIYFGELSNEYIVVNTKEEEFDYPTGTDNASTTFDADSGIKLNLFNRVMFAIQERSMKLLVSSNITKDSKIIINRNIAERVEKIMPYLSYSDPYMVTAEGKLYWVIDAYTTSKQYPYSEPYNIAAGDTTNYIRNSVKVVIDAYSGDTGFYRVDDKDPVANTLKEIYPKLFREFKDMPKGVDQHIRYPGTMLNIQANVYKRYHVKNVNVFYQGEDRWDIANEKLGASDKEVPMTPNYYIMKLPGEDSVEFVNSIPYTPKDKNNMTSLLVARNDGENYGKLVLYQFPKGKIVMGPSQVDAQIAQDATISKDFSLWENSGSTYSRGNMFVIPIENSIMYVEPIYLKASNSSMPEVKRVIIYYNDKIAYETTLAEALDAMFGQGVGDNTATLPGSENVDDGEDSVDGDEVDAGDGADGGDVGMSQKELIAAANEAYSNAVELQKSGDWAGYGKELANLQRYLEMLSAE
ncbi:MAG: UPF0182 family protein [Clostridiales Family XIII bacterium]|jgi:uncharacterized membrane protein (UPF0182 family)|nr:UPF0182 family protein [Clostridiales Family XIII bacterium]